MGVRFRRSIRVAKGVKLNLSKSGIGVSGGVKGARVGIGPRGAYRSLGIPGTGIFMFDYLGKKKKPSSQQNHTHPKEPQTPPLPPAELPQLSLPSYPNFLLVISLILLITIPLIGILGLLAYIIIRVNLNKTPLYQAHKLITEGAQHLKKDNHTEAINAYESALNLCPAANSLNKTLADLYLTEENFTAAAQSYQAYLTDHPEDTAVKPKYAISLARSGNIEEAISTLQSLPQELQEHPQIISTLGAFFLEADHPEMALNVLKNGPTRRRIMDEDMMLFRYTLGLAYQENGDRKNALNQFQRVYAKDINYLDVKEQIDGLAE
jgi:tetratricopeptide (TPR) repeat protein